MPFADVARQIRRPPVLAGLDRTASELRARVEALLQRFGEQREDAMPIADEAAAFALWGTFDAEPFLIWYREQGGLVRSLEVLLAALAYDRRTYEWDSSIWALARARPAIGLRNLGATPWYWLRAEVAKASAAERTAVRDVARGGHRSWHVRAALAFVVPGDDALWTAADEAELRQADIDDPVAVAFGVLAATRRTDLAGAHPEHVYGIARTFTGPKLVAALGAQAVPALRLVLATAELASLGEPDGLRALAELADRPEAWAPLASLPPTSATIAALAPMFTTRRPRRVLGLSLAMALFRELCVAAPAEAAKVAGGTGPEATLVAQVLGEVGVMLPADEGWRSPWGANTKSKSNKKQRDADTKALARNPRLPARAPRLPAFVDLDRLPRPIRHDEAAALAPDGLRELVQVIKAIVPGEHAILDPIVERYTPASLARMAWSLFRQWLFANAPPKDKWALHVAGQFPDDDHARTLGRLARVWAPAGNSARAQQAIEALAAMRTQAGLIEIHDIARHVQSKALRARAETVFHSVAESLGLGPAELADRLVPELSEADLAFGDAHVEFDGKLVPRLVAPDGAVVDKPSAADASRFRALKKTCAAVARGQIARLEQMMAEAIRMPFAHFAEIYSMHSLIRHLARGLVWGAYRGRELAFVFALDRDGPVGTDGEPLELPIDAAYGVVHPAELGAEVCAAWKQRMPEQPFAQLERASFTADTVDTVRASLRDFLGRTIPTARLLELQRRGWRRGDAPHRGQYYTIERSGPGWSSEIAFEPGIYLGAPTEQPTQILRGVSFDANGKPPLAVISELQHDLARLTT